MFLFHLELLRLLSSLQGSGKCPVFPGEVGVPSPGHLGLWAPPSGVNVMGNGAPSWWNPALHPATHAAGRAALAKPLRDSAAMGPDGLGWERPIHAFMALFSSH